MGHYIRYCNINTTTFTDTDLPFKVLVDVNLLGLLSQFEAQSNMVVLQYSTEQEQYRYNNNYYYITSYSLGWGLNWIGGGREFESSSTEFYVHDFEIKSTVSQSLPRDLELRWINCDMVFRKGLKYCHPGKAKCLIIEASPTCTDEFNEESYVGICLYVKFDTNFLTLLICPFT